jgi:hypothetical protein
MSIDYTIKWSIKIKSSNQKTVGTGCNVPIALVLNTWLIELLAPISR